jgi:hypothetical protein
MRVPASLRHLAWLGLLVIAPAVAGPGAIVATLAAFATFEDEPAHSVSIQQDVGHDDFVICHDARGAAASGAAAIASADCADDHRFHAASTESLASRHEAANLQPGAPLVLAASPLVLAAPTAEGLPAPGPALATLVAARHQRTVVLRI